MRDEEGRKKEASKVKQTTKQSNTAHPRQSLFQRKNELPRVDSKCMGEYEDTVCTCIHLPCAVVNMIGIVVEEIECHIKDSFIVLEVVYNALNRTVLVLRGERGEADILESNVRNMFFSIIVLDRHVS